ncbi:MAG: NAD(P)/FAD-dependent oxidoreductase [Candidatus Cloacimonadaceae bacterium]
MDLTQTFDIIIAGGGPAGLAAAKASANKGLRVLVLEKSLEIGYPIHTSGGSWIPELKALGIPDQYIHPIHRLEFISKSASASFHYAEPEICIIDIRAVYQHLAEQAALAGAMILTNTTVKEALLEQGRICGVRAVRNGIPVHFKARLVIDASGFGGVLAHQLGLAKPVESFGNGAEYEIITKGWQQDKSTILLGSDFLPAGYAWLFPYGENRVRVGFGTISPVCKEDPLKLLENFLSSEHPIAQQLRPFSIIETHLGSVPNSGYIDKSYSDNLLIAGDAAGQVLGIAGEGIRLALEIGALAGETAAQAIKGNDTSAAFLKQYETSWKAKFARSIEINARMNHIIRNYKDTQWDKAVTILKEVDPAIVLALMKGNFDLKLLSLILTRNPGLLAYSAMKIIRKAIQG